MKITLHNIGIIQDSNIQLDGLTVITGENNSGKTTVGKVLYSLLDAVTNIQNKAINDRNYYIGKKLDEIKSTLDFFRYQYILRDQKIDHHFGDEDSKINILFSSRNYKSQLQNSELENFAHELFDELSSLYTKIENNKEIINYYSKYISKNDPLIATNILKEQINRAKDILKNLFDNLEKDSELFDYTRESINETLRIEFANQIQPVIQPIKKSKIKLTGENSIYFDIEIVDNRVVNNGKPIFITAPYQKTYLIDNPFIIDAPSNIRYINYNEVEVNDSLLNIGRIRTHDHKLSLVLRNGNRSTVFEKMILNEYLVEIKKQIDQVIPGEFEFNREGDYYILDGKKLKVANLATGSKMFSILKILLENGEIDETTMLILDEPEAHLHPSWQNKFAEIIVLLVKELNTNILLTTHSPNFMLAIDAYMREYDISLKTNFYQTNYLKNGFVEYQCVNDDMGKIYADFMKYLSEVKVLRNKNL